MDYYPSPALPLPPGSLAQNGAEFELVHHFCTVTVDTLSLREVSKRGATSRRLFSSSLATYLPRRKIFWGKKRKGLSKEPSHIFASHPISLLQNGVREGSTC